jgi:hypothetical protein
VHLHLVVQPVVAGHVHLFGIAAILERTDIRSEVSENMRPVEDVSEISKEYGCCKLTSTTVSAA